MVPDHFVGSNFFYPDSDFVVGIKFILFYVKVIPVMTEIFISISFMFFLVKHYQYKNFTHLIRICYSIPELVHYIIFIYSLFLGIS